MKHLVLTAFACFSFLLTKAQAPSFPSSGDIYLGLKKLNVLGSVLYVAAHPDDENTRLLTYFSKEKLYRTGYLSLTRGDGGQNLIGEEQGVELGLIRTQELLAARRIDKRSKQGQVLLAPVPVFVYDQYEIPMGAAIPYSLLRLIGITPREFQPALCPGQSLRFCGGL